MILPDAAPKTAEKSEDYWQIVSKKNKNTSAASSLLSPSTKKEGKDQLCGVLKDSTIQALQKKTIY